MGTEKNYNFIERFVIDNHDLLKYAGTLIVVILVVLFVGFLVAGIWIQFMKNGPKKLNSVKKHSAFANAYISEFANIRNNNVSRLSYESNYSRVANKTPSNIQNVLKNSQNNVNFAVMQPQNNVDSTVKLSKNLSGKRRNTTLEFYFEFEDKYEL